MEGCDDEAHEVSLDKEAIRVRVRTLNPTNFQILVWVSLFGKGLSEQDLHVGQVCIGELTDADFHGTNGG